MLHPLLRGEAVKTASPGLPIPEAEASRSARRAAYCSRGSRNRVGFCFEVRMNVVMRLVAPIGFEPMVSAL